MLGRILAESKTGPLANWAAPAAAALAFALSGWFAPEARRHDLPPYFAPPGDLALLSFGYNDLMADAVWLRAVQDLESCGSQKAGAAARDSGAPGSGAKGQGPRCSRGWGYRMLDSVTTLAPKFRAPYASGALFLSVVTDDPQGAAAIFERGMRELPDDWTISYQAAYNYMQELGELDRASDLLVRAGRQGAPAWVFALAAKIKTQRGQAELAIPILEAALKTELSPENEKRIRQRLDEARAALASSPSGPPSETRPAAGAAN